MADTVPSALRALHPYLHDFVGVVSSSVAAPLRGCKRSRDDAAANFPVAEMSGDCSLHGRASETVTPYALATCPNAMAAHGCSASSDDAGLNDLLFTLMQEQREQERQHQQRQQLRRQLLLRECATALLATSQRPAGDACDVAPSLPNLSSHSTVESSGAGCYLGRPASAHVPEAPQADVSYPCLKRPRYYQESHHVADCAIHRENYPQPQQTHFSPQVLDRGVLSALIQQAVAGQVRAAVSAAAEEAAASKRRAAELEQHVSALRSSLASAHNLLAASHRTISNLQRSVQDSQQQLQQERFREGSGDSDDVAAGGGSGARHGKDFLAGDEVSVCEGGPVCAGGGVFPAGRFSAAPASSNHKARMDHVCRACKFGEASVVLLPCRHLALCRACEPRTAACPACGVAKHASVHISQT